MKMETVENYLVVQRLGPSTFTAGGLVQSLFGD